MGRVVRNDNERLSVYRYYFIILTIIDFYSNGKPSVFARFLGVAPSTISSWLARDTFDSELLFAKCENLNPQWLISGEGSMLVSENTTAELDSEVKNDAVLSNYQRLPLVTQTAVAGFGNADFAIHEADVKEYYSVPKFRYHQVDFMIEISGSSMYPKYNSGDVVACTILHDGAFIQWNKCHIVATREQGILCKRIMPGSTDDTLKMVSDNENYPPFEVPKEDITGIALVVGVIRLE